jgi:hypothetical protein
VNARRSTRTLAYALSVSAAAHALLAGETFIALPQAPVEPAALLVHARLAALTPPAAASTAVATPKARVPRTPPVAPLPEATRPASPQDGEPGEAVAHAEDGVPDEDALAAATPEPAVAAHPAQAPASDGPTPGGLPRRGRILYTLFLGTERFEVGRTVQTWDVQDGSYRIGSESETSGLAAVFRREKRTYSSEGEVTPEGLRPRSFHMSRMSRGETQVARARFDWDARSITWGAGRERHEAELPARSQDFLSLLFQFALVPPGASRIAVPITTGTKFETYVLDVLPEETLETPLGALRTVPLRQVRRPGAESLQVWLAADYGHLPVQLRFFGRDGAPTGEQVVSEIHLADN